MIIGMQQTMSYALFKIKTIDLEGVQGAYEISKGDIEHYKKQNLKIVKTIEEFVNNYKKSKI